MEEMEVPLEQSQEHIQHHATHGGGGEEGAGKKWVLGVALSSAIFAALAAVASLQAGHHANEAIVAQIESSKQTIRASDTWTQYQAKSIKGAIAESRISLLKSLDKTPPAEDQALVEHYKADQKTTFDRATEFQHEADVLQKEGEHHLESHIPLARAVTMFQVSIAVAAISVLTQRRIFWWVSLIFGAIGLCFELSGFLK